MLVYFRASSTIESFTCRIASLGFSWSVWIPMLLVTRVHPQFNELLVLGPFGPSIAANVIFYR